MTQVLPCLGAEPDSVIRRTKNLLFYRKRDLTHGVVGQLPYKPMISFIRDRLDFSDGHIQRSHNVLFPSKVAKKRRLSD